jgi:hypothetical protein
MRSGDVVLLQDKGAHRHDWSTGLIVETFPSSDNNIRKVKVRVIKEDKVHEYIRPVTDIVLLVNDEQTV